MNSIEVIVNVLKLVHMSISSAISPTAGDAHHGTTSDNDRVCTDKMFNPSIMVIISYCCSRKSCHSILLSVLLLLALMIWMLSLKWI